MICLFPLLYFVLLNICLILLFHRKLMSFVELELKRLLVELSFLWL